MSMRSIFFLVVALLVAFAMACGDDDNASTATPDASTGNTELSWEQVLPPGSGGFIPYPGSGDEPKWEPGKYPMTLHPMIAFNGDLWMVSSTKLAFSSADAIHWQSHDKDETPGRLASSTTFFNDKLWIYAGSEDRGLTFTNEMWSSSDGSNWTKEGNAEWPGRDSATFVEFQDKLWILGGATHRDPNSLHTDSFLNDVWSSDDGVTWTQVTASAPWAARSYPRIVIRDDEMYMLGGETHADVWKSGNGKDWTQLTAEAPWAGAGRQGYAAEVYDNKFWVMGGFVGDSKNGVNDIWFSEDGATWIQQAEHAPWTPRDPISIVYQDKLWVYAGKYTGSKDSWNGDLWTLS